MVKVITRKLVDVSDFLPYPMTALKWWDTFQQLLINASQDIIGCLSSEIKIMFLFWMGCRESNQGEYLSSRMCMSSVRCGERCYLFALWFHIHLMASLVWVQLTKVLTSRRQVDYLIDMWERVWIFGTSLLRPVKSTHILQLLLGFRTSTGWLANPCFDVSDIVGRLRRWTSSRMASFLSGRGGGISGASAASGWHQEKTWRWCSGTSRRFPLIYDVLQANTPRLSWRNARSCCSRRLSRDTLNFTNESSETDQGRSLSLSRVKLRCPLVWCVSSCQSLGIVMVGAEVVSWFILAKKIRSSLNVGVKWRRIMAWQSYDLKIVIEESRDRGGAQRDLVSDEGDMMVLPRFRPPLDRS